MTAPAPTAGFTPQKLSLAHQVLVNYLAQLSVQVVEDDRTKLALDMLETILLEVRPSFPVIAHVIEGARAVVKAAPQRCTKDGAADWCRAMMTAQGALAHFFNWRAALAWDALHPQPEAKDVA